MVDINLFKEDGEEENEWSPDDRFNLNDLRKMIAVKIKGNSSEPIARNGQYVLLKKEISPDEVNDSVDDLLAVIDTVEDVSGTVVKRIHRNGDLFHHLLGRSGGPANDNNTDWKFNVGH